MRYDIETGCYYDRARYYCPGIGRFLQTDSVGYKDDVDWYTYVDNDPTDNLYDAVATGTVGDSALFRDKLNRIEDEREETIRLLSQRRGLLEAPLPMRRRYVRGLVSQIVVDKKKAVISGPNAALAAAVTTERLNGEVRTFVREWRTGQDSNPRPPDS